jgi:erythromycin esterase-like protein
MARAKRSLPRLAALAALLLSLSHARLARAEDDAITNWIHRTARPFETCEPRDDHRDLASLRQIVGNARVVAIGEGTYGTREFFQLKHRIVEYLASEMGFTTFAIAANMPEARKINDYVLTGRGDPQALIRGLLFWPWSTEEMLEFVQWMRRFNASGRGRLQFVGFDMAKPAVPAEIVQEFFRRADPAWADSVGALSRAIMRGRRSRANFVVSRADFPASDAAGHHVRFSGWIRTRDVSEYAGLWWRAEVEGVTCAFDNMEHQKVAGTRDWQRYALELDVPAEADNIVFGTLMEGTGAAWFDSLGLEIDGRPWANPSRLGLATEGADKPAGFDMEPPPGYSIRMDDSAAAVGRWSLRFSSEKDYVPADPAQQWAVAEQSAQRVVRRLESMGRRSRGDSLGDEVEWVTRNAHLLLQRTRFGRPESARDSSMAANVEWTLQRLPRHSKMVVWAHSDQVARSPGAMGDWLAKRFGKDMLVIGLATNAGQCTTTRTTAANLEATRIQPGPEGSFEALAHASGIPRFLLDLRRAGPGSRIAAQLAKGLTMRSIGPATPTQEFWPRAVSREYDAIAWVDSTHATRPVKMY